MCVCQPTACTATARTATWRDRRVSVRNPDGVRTGRDKPPGHSRRSWVELDLGAIWLASPGRVGGSLELGCDTFGSFRVGLGELPGVLLDIEAELRVQPSANTGVKLSPQVHFG